MRKVKLLAFVLAALMVVAAFAGCGTKEIEANVSTLDERVTKLEELLNKVNENVANAATSDQINELLAAITANKAEAADGDKALADKLAQITADQATANATLKADLEKLINAAKADQTAGDKTLADAIAKISADQVAANAALKSDLEKLIDAAEKAQADGDAALQASIKALNDSIAATNKALADAVKDLEGDVTEGDKATLDAVKALLEAQNKELADAIKALSDKIAAEDKVQTELNTAKNNYTGKLEILKGQLDANSNVYTATEYTTIATALIMGVANIKNATTVEDVVKFYNDAEKVYNDCTPLSVQLENAYNALLGSVTNSDATKKAVDAYKKLADAATKQYGATGKEVIIGTGDKAVNLVSYYDTFKAAYDAAVQLAKDAKAINDAVKAIKKVYVVEDAYYADAKTNYNLDKLTAVNNSYKVYSDTIKKGDYKAVLDQDAMLALVTVVDTLEGFNADKTRLQTAIANYAFYGQLDGTAYKNVFAEYIAKAGAADVDWFDKVESIYNKVDARVNEWVDDYSIDSENMIAIINAAQKDANFYATYNTMKDYATRYLAKYNTFVADYATRVKNLNKIEKFTNADVDELVAIEDALFNAKTPWADVVLREKTDKVTEIKVNLVEDEADQLKAMYQKALARETLFAFKADTKAATFYATTFAQAKDVAAVINAEIKTLVDNKATLLNAFRFKTLDNFVPKTEGSNYYVEDKATYTVDKLFGADGKVVSNISIHMFESVFVNSDYDLTNLLHIADFEDAEAVVEARVAELKVVTDKIKADNTAIKNSLKEKKITNVSLLNESAVNELWAVYKQLSANGFQPNETYAWVYNSTETVKAYESKLLLTDEVIYDLTYLKYTVDTLRTFANNLVKTFETLATANKYDAFNANDGLTAVAKVKNDPTTDKNGVTTNHYTTITAIDVTNGKITTAKDASASLTQAKAVELAYQAYQNFVAANSKSAASGKVTLEPAVEAALTNNGFEALKLAVIKMYAYNRVESITLDKATEWNTAANQDFNTHKTMQKAIIVDAVNKEAIAVNLKHFYDLTGAAYESFTVFGITFGTNGLIAK